MIYMMMVFKYLVGIALIPLMAIQAASVNNDDDVETSLDDRTTEPMVCKTKNGKNGICVHESYCNEDHTIVPGGVIDDSELREMSKRACPGSFKWCCTQELVIAPPVLNKSNSDNCLPLESDICTWCVKLYKVSDLKHTDSEVFCAGALIGSRIVLTAASCLKLAQQLILYVRVPFSADAQRRYIAQHRKVHPQYNSGTHWYDFGIIILEEEVKWAAKPSGGACLGFTKLSGNCMTVGFDTNDDFGSTIIKVQDGTCKNMGGGGSFEAFCGVNMDNLCFSVPGAPVICESSTKSLILYGIARTHCINDHILLGSITSSTSWLSSELDAMKVSKNVYVHRP